MGGQRRGVRLRSSRLQSKQAADGTPARRFDVSPVSVLVLVAVLCYAAYAIYRVHQMQEPLRNHRQHELRQHTAKPAEPVEEPAPAQQAQQQAVIAPKTDRTLRFKVCNGFANQRLSILYGALIAKKTDRALVLPMMVSVGTQMSEWQVLADGANGMGFETFYQPEVRRRPVCAARRRGALPGLQG